MDCGEQALLSAVRDADRDTAIAADGLTQIEQAGTGRRALHLAQADTLANRLVTR